MFLALDLSFFLSWQVLEDDGCIGSIDEAGEQYIARFSQRLRCKNLEVHWGSSLLSMRNRDE